MRKNKRIATLTFQYKAPKAKPITREKNAGNAMAAHCRLESPMELAALPVMNVKSTVVNIADRSWRFSCCTVLDPNCFHNAFLTYICLKY